MFTNENITAICQSLEKGNDVLIRPKKDEIQIIEQKTKVIGRTDKSCLEKGRKEQATS